jgi:hypothetical protein
MKTPPGMRLRRSSRGRVARTWVHAGAISTALLGVGGSAAWGDVSASASRYDGAFNFGLHFGIALGPRLGLFYGGDVRVGAGQVVSFARIESFGWFQSVRLVGGAQLLATDHFFGEVGAGWHSATRDGTLGWGIGPHLGAGFWNGALAAAVSGGGVLLGDARNYKLGLGGAIIPTNNSGEFNPFVGKTVTVPGRLVHAAGGVLLPLPIFDLAAPAGVPPTLPDDEEGAYLGRRWLEDARAEYASIWAFRRLAAELAVVGAPPGLVAAALAAADDEARHAAVCLEESGLATALAPLSAEVLRPRLGQREEMLATLAREAWNDGCLGEAIAAARAETARSHARGSAAAAQTMIARDEAGHAALAWDTVGWLWREGGGHVRDTIAAAFEQSASDPSRAASATPADGLDEDFLAARGIARPEDERHAADQVWDGAHARLRRLIRGAGLS